MQLMDQELSSLISRGTQEGFLTYDEVNAYLPDEDVSLEKPDRLLMAIERKGTRWWIQPSRQTGTAPNQTWQK